MTPPTLLLFDIDGTLLLRANAAHREALHEGIREVYGVTEPERVPVDPGGRTDLEIARMILRGLGMAARHIDQGLRELTSATAHAFARLCPADLTGTVAPGMADLLERLAARRDLRLSLVTGNFEPIARRKLAAAGIGQWFAPGQGGFGSDHEDRAELPAIARRRAGGRSGPHPRQRTIVIGDTPLDIACARADGVRAVAIATGPYPARALHEADEVVADAAGLARVLGE